MIVEKVKRITLSTIKAFIRKHPDDLLIMSCSSFDGQIDGLRFVPEQGRTFVPVRWDKEFDTNTFGIEGAWFVLGSRDYLKAYSANGFTGYSVNNSCGSFILAIEDKK